MNKTKPENPQVPVASQKELLTMTSDMVAAYLSNHHVSDAEVPNVIDRIYAKLQDLNGLSPTPAPAGTGPGAVAGAGAGQYSSALRPAVSIEDSITPDYLVCLEDGVRLKMLKRHLRATYNMTPEQYRAKWSLPADYPMVAPNYAKVRSAHAKRIGLGKNADMAKNADMSKNPDASKNTDQSLN